MSFLNPFYTVGIRDRPAIDRHLLGRNVETDNEGVSFNSKLPIQWVPLMFGGEGAVRIEFDEVFRILRTEIFARVLMRFDP